MSLANYLLANFANGLLVVFFFLATFHLIDRMTPEVNFEKEIKKGNLAVGIVLAGLLVGIGLAIGGAIR